MCADVTEQECRQSILMMMMMMVKMMMMIDIQVQVIIVLMMNIHTKVNKKAVMTLKYLKSIIPL